MHSPPSWHALALSLLSSRLYSWKRSNWPPHICCWRTEKSAHIHPHLLPVRWCTTSLKTNNTTLAVCSWSTSYNNNCCDSCPFFLISICMSAFRKWGLDGPRVSASPQSFNLASFSYLCKNYRWSGFISTVWLGQVGIIGFPGVEIHIRHSRLHRER